MHDAAYVAHCNPVPSVTSFFPSATLLIWAYSLQATNAAFRMYGTALPLLSVWSLPSEQSCPDNVLFPVQLQILKDVSPRSF